ncbi:LD-carboxypeptidase [Deinococcus detaillensis]|uniref:LD-carboxypeptidase n=1 Tax=Deinococcus detaillensis TaxID=2592048 RepID=A0A553V3M0_9DEIO|nr:S66 peptidase family protein [Deinococcus detaillensis]TSA87093.1 LD-carboxypeptidase [Deinococcus detaillensis]
MTPQFIRPAALKSGDKVAALSLSSGFVTEVMHRYEAGKRQIESAFGWQIVPAPNALRGEEYLYRNPQARADDLHWALENPEIAGLLSVIGGDDSVRLLPYLNLELICAHPKVFMGFSDASIILMQFLRAGVHAFYGPALLTDLAENGGIHPDVARGVSQAAIAAVPFTVQPNSTWTEQRQAWLPELQETPRQFASSEGWTWLQGERPAEGHLIGGCLEVLDMLNGTSGWPEPELWYGAILAFETSEDVPPPAQVGYWLRNFAVQGILQNAAGLVWARPRGYTPQMVQDLYGWIKKVLWEAGREDLPVLANVEFGHTSPQLTLPLGARAKLDPVAGTFSVLESAVS